MMGIDIYSLASKIAKDIENEGVVGFAKEIEELISNGTTGTEIIMSLRWRYRKLLKENTISDNIFEDIKYLINSINSIIEEGTKRD